MKRISTLFAALLMSIFVFAADAKPKSILTITSVDNSDIRVVLDGKRFEPNDNSLRIQGIEDGYHTLKVYRQRNNGIFSIVGKRYELVYNTTIAVKKRTNLFITVERNGFITKQENKISNKRYDRDWDRDNGYNNNDRDFDYEKDGHWGDYDRNEAYASGMNDREFRTVLQSIDKEWLESNKLKSALQVSKVNSLTAAQVKQMLLLFSFENNKLELAKQAYANTVDKRNYSIVFDVFSFSANKAELQRFIAGRR